MIYTYNEYHLGDNLIHLNYLRRLVLAYPKLAATHYCHAALHPQLEPVIEGVDIEIKDIQTKPEGAIHAWIGSEGYFYNHPSRKSWVMFHLCWFARLAQKLGVSNPVVHTEDLLMSWPDLSRGQHREYDYLLINSPPMSNQLPDFSQDWFANKARQLLKEGHSVISTYDLGFIPSTVRQGLTVSQIGSLSRGVKHIIAVDTGPLWPTFNVHNQGSVLTRTIYGRTSERMDLAPNTVCKPNLEN